MYRNNGCTLCFRAKSYILHLLRTYKTIFGEQAQPKEYSSPFIAMTILNSDTSDELSELDIKRVQ
jgi:hypothetical protein